MIFNLPPPPPSCLSVNIHPWIKDNLKFLFKVVSYAILTFDILELVKKWRRLSMNPAENTRLTWRFGEEAGFGISIYLCNFDLRNIFIMLVYIESGITLSITDVAIKRFVFTFYGCFSLQDHYHDWNNKNCQRVNQDSHFLHCIARSPLYTISGFPPNFC